MERYEYRCVNAPTGIVVRKETDRDQAIKAYENIINQEAAEGWEYVGMDSYTTHIKPDCSTPRHHDHYEVNMQIFQLSPFCQTLLKIAVGNCANSDLTVPKLCQIQK